MIKINPIIFFISEKKDVTLNFNNKTQITILTILICSKSLKYLKPCQTRDDISATISISLILQTKKA